MYEFFRRYVAEVPVEGAGELTLADQWILSRLSATVEAVEGAWAGYDVTTGTRAIMDFVVDDLANWYVRTNRSRFWAPDSEADAAAARTLHRCLETICRLLAPAAPFVSDWVHREISGQSVHLSRFPEPGNRDVGLETAMDAVRRLASLARSARETGDVRVRQPLRTLQAAVPAAVRGPAFDALLPVLAAEVNVRRVSVAESDAGLVRLKARPNFRALGKRFGKRTPAIAAAATGLGADALRALEAGTTAVLAVDGEEVTLEPDDVSIEREVASDWLVASEGPFVAALDPVLDDELRSEGLAREVVSRVQRLRRDAGYDYTTRIELYLDADASLADALRPHLDAIAGEVLARRVHPGARAPRPDIEQHFDLDGASARVGLMRFDSDTTSTPNAADGA